MVILNKILKYDAAWSQLYWTKSELLEATKCWKKFHRSWQTFANPFQACLQCWNVYASKTWKKCYDTSEHFFHVLDRQIGFLSSAFLKYELLCYATAGEFTFSSTLLAKMSETLEVSVLNHINSILLW